MIFECFRAEMDERTTAAQTAWKSLQIERKRKAEIRWHAPYSVREQ
jgi:hypothetical protein